ncbi:MAG TPA: branched-chain amino acid ABC transporter permease [Chloroflexota bacterium]|nr:branched-chain amino acid ABC transporter permease [Chloroflexota bacterium]
MAKLRGGLLGGLRPGYRLIAGWLIVLLAAILLPIVLGPTGHQQDLTDDFVQAEVYAMLALGLNVVVGFAGLLDLGYAAFFAIGAYTFGLLSSAQFQPSSRFSSPIINWGPTGIHANFWIFLPGCALIAALFGFILGAPTLRLRGDYLAIVTLGFGEIVHKTVLNLGPSNALGWPDITGGDNSLAGIFQPQLGPLQFSTDQVPWYYLGLIVLAVIIIIAYSLQNSRLGRAWVAMREDELAASCMGINLTRTKLLAFAMGAFFSGFAGVIQGSRIGAVNPQQFTFTVSISILVMVVLGGIGSVPGVVLGASLIALIQFYLLDQLNTWAHGNFSIGPLNLTYPGIVPASFDVNEAEYLIFGILLVLMMVFRPEGLIPSGRRRRELHPTDEGIRVEENQQLYDMRSEGA